MGHYYKISVILKRSKIRLLLTSKKDNMKERLILFGILFWSIDRTDEAVLGKRQYIKASLRTNSDHRKPRARVYVIWIINLKQTIVLTSVI